MGNKVLIRIIIVFGCLSTMLSVQAQDGRKYGASTPLEADRWELEAIYQDDDAWLQDYKKIEQDLNTAFECKMHLLDTPQMLRRCVEHYENSSMRLARLWSYASMLSDQDVRVGKHYELRQKASMGSTQFSSAWSFLRPSVLEAGKVKIDSMLESYPPLAEYEYFLSEILRTRLHVLPLAQEELLIKTTALMEAPKSFYTLLTSADIDWPEATFSNDQKIRLDQSGYVRMRGAKRREDRRAAFDVFWGVWKQYERSTGAALYAQLRQHDFVADVRHYENTLTASLDDENIPMAVYDRLLTEVNRGMPVLHRYFRLRGKMLGIEDLRYYDIYPPMLDYDRSFSLEEAKELTIRAVSILGDAYTEVMKKGFVSRWMDAYPQPGKVPGAYSNGSVYELHPFVLMNYHDDYESVSTLAHEWGHAMHSYLANRNQGFLNADYATFMAEVASTVNEALLLSYMLEHAKNSQERLFYLGQELENYRGTFFRQAMFAEFERDIHRRVENKQALSGQSFSDIYIKLLRRYHGQDDGVMIIDDAYGMEWAYVPHFYYNYYVYQYATSITAAHAFASGLLAGDEAIIETYLNLLRAGGSANAYQLLRDAGVDLARPEPYRRLIARMDVIMDEMESILEKDRQ